MKREREREYSPFRLLLLALVAMLKAAMMTRMRSGRRKMIKVLRESRCNDGIDCGWEHLGRESVESVLKSFPNRHGIDHDVLVLYF